MWMAKILFHELHSTVKKPYCQGINILFPCLFRDRKASIFSLLNMFGEKLSETLWHPFDPPVKKEHLLVCCEKEAIKYIFTPKLERFITKLDRFIEADLKILRY